MGQTSSVSTVEVNEFEALQAARKLAAVLAETPEYQAFDLAQLRLWQDMAAQEAIRTFQGKQQALGWRLQLGMLEDAEREELQRLQWPSSPSTPTWRPRNGWACSARKLPGLYPRSSA